MTMGPSREACDRCHAMKTRCVRASSVHACVRCTRLGFDCHYSPPGKTGRPPGSKRKPSVTEKRSEKSSATTTTTSTPRSSPHTRPVPCRKPRRQQSLHQQDDIASLVSSASSVSSVGGLNAVTSARDFADVDFFNTPPSVPEEESMNLFFMDDYIPELNDQFAHSQSASSPPETYSLMGGNQFQYPEPKSAYSAPSNPYTGEDDLLHTLLDMQTRLAKINKHLARSGNTTTDIDDIHRTTETLISILDGYDERTGQQIAPVLSSGNGVVVLLLSSCYVSLIQAYESVATTLRADLQKSSGSESMTGMQPQHFLFPNMMPSVTVGSVGLSMPQKAITEVNLHVVAQTVQRLKTAMNNCSTRMAMPRFMQSHPALANASGLGSIWGSSQVQSNFAPVSEFTSAVAGSKMPEDSLYGHHLATSTF
ncbi:hypothetical protein VHEMI00043 [[Torrubiella] hemipterigena]|uniref:Zn(2)-C6 fungal-type domain-containing protein n=1 Tax=[Torrubiella] hemipterigena TaxID=1531966 RepID=A0A0A1SPA7_9HYPO|nr:hypothetical protein VHEMI00043 [[Torrubiella] hemipterigena]